VSRDAIMTTTIRTMRPPVVETEGALRATCRPELTDELRHHLTVLLRQAAFAAPIEPIERLRAAGRDLAYLRGFAALVEHQCADAEPDQGRSVLGALASGAVREIDRLVQLLDRELGLGHDSWRLAGLRETYIAGVRSPEVRRALQRMVELAHAESLAEAPAPGDPMACSMKGLADELLHLAGYLSAQPEPVALRVGRGCRRIAGAIHLVIENHPTLDLLAVDNFAEE
jgi:hypothetical protein